MVHCAMLAVPLTLAVLAMLVPAGYSSPTPSMSETETQRANLLYYLQNDLTVPQEHQYSPPDSSDMDPTNSPTTPMNLDYQDAEDGWIDQTYDDAIRAWEKNEANKLAGGSNEADMNFNTNSHSNNAMDDDWWHLSPYSSTEWTPENQKNQDEFDAQMRNMEGII
ncbi:hypothetical protein H4R33_000588 [Dimargaris cristalligena]|uniref:Uncharacterized protein n=1 Tax=Dimargaris cristalligena TaxID=215637 RepID=A0A4V1J5Q0_9FUNG|nr:hypothetical protein H4R33_000588 [Dimargaris cristalligena]RKP39829.1 hypothetical protein BJ085DRAFT_33382 [Dimargaris cristalligena]|eukprot:RKP39829.1 hypothetical protein BJ085DRAFT_33382 [Dimargaris cristalligena]